MIIFRRSRYRVWLRVCGGFDVDGAVWAESISGIGLYGYEEVGERFVVDGVGSA